VGCAVNATVCVVKTAHPLAALREVLRKRAKCAEPPR
jgi:hypothetical protein